jgi:hypothetical protein
VYRSWSWRGSRGAPVGRRPVGAARRAPRDGVAPSRCAARSVIRRAATAMCHGRVVGQVLDPTRRRVATSASCVFGVVEAAVPSRDLTEDMRRPFAQQALDVLTGGAGPLPAAPGSHRPPACRPGRKPPRSSQRSRVPAPRTQRRPANSRPVAPSTCSSRFGARHGALTNTSKPPADSRHPLTATSRDGEIRPLRLRATVVSGWGNAPAGATAPATNESCRRPLDALLKRRTEARLCRNGTQHLGAPPLRRRPRRDR